jgi:hypothetical protein
MAGDGLKHGAGLPAPSGKDPSRPLNGGRWIETPQRVLRLLPMQHPSRPLNGGRWIETAGCFAPDALRRIFQTAEWREMD